MRQRLGLARCLLSDPELLILDEPLNGLDPAGILEMRRLIREFVDEGRMVLLSSHLLDEVEKTCDVAAIVDHGRIVARGTIGELVNGGARAIDIGCDSAAAAVRLLAAVPGVLRAIGVLLAFFLAIEPLLSLVGFLGAVRQGLPAVAIGRIGHMPILPGNVAVAAGTGIAVAIPWGIATLGLGAWKTTTREI